jgi:hypothetical protein
MANKFPIGQGKYNHGREARTYQIRYYRPSHPPVISVGTSKRHFEGHAQGIYGHETHFQLG